MLYPLSYEGLRDSVVGTSAPPYTWPMAASSAMRRSRSSVGSSISQPAPSWRNWAMAEPQCLEDHDLLPLLDGRKAPKMVADHVQACAACRRRLQRLRAEVQSLRGLQPRRGGSE